MLDRAGDDVLAPRDLERLGDASNRDVVALGSAAREHNFRRICAKKRGHLGPGLVERGLGPLAEVVNARRVAELLPEDGAHAVDGRRGRRRRGVMVEVDAGHSC